MEMETSSAQLHRQEIIGSQTLESMLVCTKPQEEKKPRPADQEAIKCPRCDSANTKFCYYNNYSLSQPRYFCKSCRRYWTKGGTLRNVPVGGGCRKNKRSSSSTSTSSSSRRNQDHPMPSPIPCLTHLSYDHEHHSSDLSLAIARLQKQTNLQLGYDNLDFSILGNPNMAQSEGLVNSGVNTPTGYLEAPGGFHMYYVMENGGMGINGISQEMGLGFEELGSTTVTNVKQEMCAGNGREDESGRVLWEFPWHEAGGDHGSHIGETDSSRLSWNGLGSANWHGLLNSPLM